MAAESKFVTDRRRAALSLPGLRRDMDERDRDADPRQIETGQSHSLRDTPLRQGEAPPRGAILGMGGTPTPAPGPPPTPNPQPTGPNPNKLADRAAVAAAATAAVLAEHAREDPRGQASNQKPPPPPGGPTHTAGGIGTGPGAASERPPGVDYGKAGPTDPKGPVSAVRLPDGRVVWGNQGKEAVSGGGTPVSWQEGMGGRPGLWDSLGEEQAKRFMKDRTSRESSGSERLPYSQQVRNLASTDAPDLSAPGSDWNFQGGIEGGPGMARTGTRELSGIEQAVARRTWLEGRADTEQANETARAKLEHEQRLAEMDPLEMARIQAQGRMGGDLAKVQLDLRARQAAVQEHQRMSGQIEQAQAAMAAAEPGSEDAMQLKQYIEYLIQTRRELSNLILGERLSDPRAVGDAFGAALAGLGFAGGAAAANPGAR